MARRAGITANATLPHFVRGLLPDIKAVVKTHAPANLSTALTKAKLYEQGKGTSKRHKKTKKYESSSEDSDNETSEDEKPRSKKKETKKKKPSSDEEMDELTKRFNKLQINLMQQVEGIAKQAGRRERTNEPRQPYPRNNNNNNQSYNNNYNPNYNNSYNSNFLRRCYKCNEIGHFARDCLSEKKQPQSNKNVSYVEYNSEEDYEIYEAIRNKPNTRSNPIRKPGRPPKTPATPRTRVTTPKVQEPEILVDFEEDPYEETAEDIEMKEKPIKATTKPKAQRTKRQPSIIDRYPKYDISENILNSQANVYKLLKENQPQV